MAHGGQQETIIAVALIAVFVVCIAWSVAHIRSCCLCFRRQNDDIGVVVAEQQAQADLATLRQIVQEQRNISGMGAMTLEDRKGYIMNVLMTKHVILPTASDEESQTEQCDLDSDTEGSVTKTDFVLTTKPAQSTQEATSNSEVTCPICLSEYKDGEEISWSHNSKCNHFFHRSCIAEWLLSHDECPCCRVNFLCFEEDDEVAGIPSRGLSTEDPQSFFHNMQLLFELASFSQRLREMEQGGSRRRLESRNGGGEQASDEETGRPGRTTL